MIESGEKERLMELLRERLTECGWKDEMKTLCRFSSPLYDFIPPLQISFIYLSFSIYKHVNLHVMYIFFINNLAVAKLLLVLNLVQSFIPSSTSYILQNILTIKRRYITLWGVPPSCHFNKTTFINHCGSD